MSPESCAGGDVLLEKEPVTGQELLVWWTERIKNKAR